MKLRSLAIAFVFSLGSMLLLLSVSAPRADADQSTPISVQPSSCGFTKGFGPLNCYTVNLTIGGVKTTADFTFDQIIFRGGEGAPDVWAIPTSHTFTYNSVGVPISETITYQTEPNPNGQSADPDNNGDVDVVTGSITFYLSYGPPLRYGMRVLNILSGMGAQSIMQD